MQSSGKECLFSERVRLLRTQRGLTQQQFADALGVSREAVNYMEARAKNPRAETLMKVASFFDVPVAYFFQEDSQDGESRL